MRGRELGEAGTWKSCVVRSLGFRNPSSSCNAAEGDEGMKHTWFWPNSISRSRKPIDTHNYANTCVLISQLQFLMKPIFCSWVIKGVIFYFKSIPKCCNSSECSQVSEINRVHFLKTLFIALGIGTCLRKLYNAFSSNIIGNCHVHFSLAPERSVLSEKFNP